ncbi:hemin uptake protein HemP [Rhodobacter capsulatus]|uniref:Hemin uptake protein HemP n=1 Tax=Rhodobacter capsulatus TaxID=1061 RepID=A0A4U1JLI3_RHOCA|nr:hemin uptake protein HemP [Rhodobacter capsulatus]
MCNDEGRPKLALGSVADRGLDGVFGGQGPDAGQGSDIAPPLHDARALTEGGSLVRIVLDGVTYTLRITRNGKLILTK